MHGQLNAVFGQLSNVVGASPDELKLITTFFLSYPLAAILKRIPDSLPALKNLFSVCVSIWYLIGIFDLGDGLQSLIISSAGTYAIAKYMRGSPYMPWVGFFFVMGHMSVSQIRRQLADAPNQVDITGAQMVLLIKLSSFCWNLADGLVPDEMLEEFQKQTRLKDLPSVLDFAGYVFFFPSLMIGPACDFIEYKSWLDTSMFDLPADVAPSTRPPVRRNRRVPRSGGPAMWKAATGLFWLVLFVIFSGPFNPDILISQSFVRKGFLHRVLLLYLVNLTARFKYYGVWTLTEGACVLTGLGYKGLDAVTGKVMWNRVENINPLGVETAQNARAYMGAWNIKTTVWLRHCVFNRVTPWRKRPGFRATLATFMACAVWHGFYPGYYLTFLLGNMIQTVAKDFHRYVRPFFLNAQTRNERRAKLAYDVASWAATQFAFSFATAPFLVLSLSGSFLVWQRVYFYGVVGTVAALAFFATPAKRLLHAKLDRRRADKPWRSSSQDSLLGREPILGVAGDPARDFTEAVLEVKGMSAGLDRVARGRRKAE